MNGPSTTDPSQDWLGTIMVLGDVPGANDVPDGASAWAQIVVGWFPAEFCFQVR
jgi:hypothetical protein